MSSETLNLKTPEKIVFVDGITGSIREEVNFEEVPPSIRFAKSKDGVHTPVAKIVDMTMGGKREIRQYAANDELLRITFQRRES